MNTPGPKGHSHGVFQGLAAAHSIANSRHICHSRLCKSSSLSRLFSLPWPWHCMRYRTSFWDPWHPGNWILFVLCISSFFDLIVTVTSFHPGKTKKNVEHKRLRSHHFLSEWRLALFDFIAFAVLNISSVGNVQSVLQSPSPEPFKIFTKQDPVAA